MILCAAMLLSSVLLDVSVSAADDLPFDDTVSGQWYSESVGWAAENNLYPNIPYGEHQWSPVNWRGELDPPYFVTKLSDVTVPYPEDPIDIRSMFQ